MKPNRGANNKSLELAKFEGLELQVTLFLFFHGIFEWLTCREFDGFGCRNLDFFASTDRFLRVDTLTRPEFDRFGSSNLSVRLYSIQSRSATHYGSIFTLSILIVEVP
jgi:hypothetical protein